MYGVPVGACVCPVVPCFFDVFPPDFCLVCVYEGGDFFVLAPVCLDVVACFC